MAKPSPETIKKKLLDGYAKGIQALTKALLSAGKTVGITAGEVKTILESIASSL